jgi:hypothetical protein
MKFTFSWLCNVIFSGFLPILTLQDSFADTSSTCLLSNSSKCCHFFHHL